MAQGRRLAAILESTKEGTASSPQMAVLWPGREMAPGKATGGDLGTEEEGEGILAPDGIVWAGEGYVTGDDLGIEEGGERIHTPGDSVWDEEEDDREEATDDNDDDGTSILIDEAKLKSSGSEMVHK